jgi:hypothetical protein
MDEKKSLKFCLFIIIRHIYRYRYAGRERDSCFFLQNTTPKLIKSPASLLASLGLRLRDGERGADKVSKHGSSSGGLRRST